MQTIEYFRTFDGKVHVSDLQANRHLDNLRAEIVTKLVHKIDATSEGSRVREVLNNSVEDMRMLVKIEDDRTIEPVPAC